jgi:hypothetical protein
VFPHGRALWWFAPHPDWKPGEDWDEEVPVVRHETVDEVVIIDPFLPRDRRFDPHGRPVRVLLTQGAHYRGTADFVERYGASVRAAPRAVWRRRPNPATTEELPRGVDAIEPRLHVFVDEVDPERLLPALDALGDLAIERVIIPHGRRDPRGRRRAHPRGRCRGASPLTEIGAVENVDRTSACSSSVREGRMTTTKGADDEVPAAGVLGRREDERANRA